MRRQSVRPQACFSLLTLLGLGVVGCGEPVHLERRSRAMGEPLSVELYVAGEREAELALADINTHLEAVESMTDREWPDSDLARLNAGATEGYHVVVDADFFRLLRLALDYAHVTRGAYDPTAGPLERLYRRGPGRAPTPEEIRQALERVGWQQVTVAPEGRAVSFRQPTIQLDLDTVARGFALDVAARAFARPGSYAGLLQLGNDLLVWNHPPDQERWTVRLHDPRSSDREFLRLSVANRGVALAGQPLTGDPTVIDPRSGLPAASDVLAALAISDSAADAAATAPALLVLGSKAGGELLSKMNRVEAVLLCSGGGEPYLLASATLGGRIELSPALSAEVGGREVRYILPPQELELMNPLRHWRE